MNIPKAKSEAKSEARAKSVIEQPTLQQLGSEAYKLARDGYSVGAMVKEKKLSLATPALHTGGELMIITDVDEDNGSVQVRQAFSYSPDLQYGWGSFEDIRRQWQVVQRQNFPKKFIHPRHPEQEIWMQETKALLFRGISKLFAEQTNYTDQLMTWTGPPQLRTVQTAIPKGKLVLVPMCGLNNITVNKSGGGSLHIGSLKCGAQPYHGNVGITADFYLNKPAHGKTVEDAADETGMCIPYWWVRSTWKAGEENMCMTNKNVEIDGHRFTIPCMINTVNIQPYSEVLIYKEATPKAEGPKQQVSTFKPSSPAGPPAKAKAATKEKAPAKTPGKASAGAKAPAKAPATKIAPPAKRKRGSEDER